MSHTAATNAHKRVCKATRAGGGPCEARPLTGGEFCYWHDSEQAEARRAAGSRGGSKGRIKTLPNGTPDLKVNSAASIIILLSRTINHVLRGEIDPKVANAVGYLSGMILKAREQGEFEERIKSIEKMAAQRDWRM